MFPTRLAAAGTALACLCIAAGPAAQEGAAAAPRQRAFELPPGEHLVASLLAIFERQCDAEVLRGAHPFEEQHTIRLSRPHTASGEAAADLLSHLLFSRGIGLAVVDRDRRIYRILDLQGPSAHQWPMLAEHVPPEEVLRRRRSMLPVATTIQLQHAAAGEAQNACRMLFQNLVRSGLMILASVDRSNSVVLSGPRAAVAMAIDVLRRVDVEAPEHR